MKRQLQNVTIIKIVFIDSNTFKGNFASNISLDVWLSTF